MLGYFTPSGRGCCFDKDGSILFLATLAGCQLLRQDADDKEWIRMQYMEWPAGGAKLLQPISLQVSDQNILFRFVVDLLA